MRYFILILLILIVFWVLRQRARAGHRRSSAPATEEPETMVPCDVCGLHHPISESIRVRGYHYCCDAHYRAAEKREP